MSRAATHLRPVDLARMAGISTQQVRNYLDDGILPPAPRSPAGYRRFDTRHAQALLTYRALAAGYGWDAARAIMRAVHDDDLPAALALVDAGHAALHEQRLSLNATGQALHAVARQTPETAPTTAPTTTLETTLETTPETTTDATGTTTPPRGGMRIGELAAHLGVRTSALRVWEAAGLLTPRREPHTGYRRYGPAEIRDAQMINMLRRGRYLFPQIQTILDGLRRTGSSQALQQAIAQRHTELNRRAATMLEAAARLHHYIESAHPGDGDHGKRSAAE
ncbi:MerR family transcriptional regulator [Thermopolyspora sp. NPDC052614]|uniref:MerR family transcriptional regulator n=1 Tax=Thermopolyspora sp. NPDC052614 TaxID=3155682 RepID=UPI0034313601